MPLWQLNMQVAMLVALLPRRVITCRQSISRDHFHDSPINDGDELTVQHLSLSANAVQFTLTLIAAHS